MRHHLSHKSGYASAAAHPPDIIMLPDVSKFGSLDFKDTLGPMEAGVVCAEQHLEAIRALLVS